MAAEEARIQEFESAVAEQQMGNGDEYVVPVPQPSEAFHAPAAAPPAAAAPSATHKRPAVCDLSLDDDDDDDDARPQPRGGASSAAGAAAVTAPAASTAASLSASPSLPSKRLKGASAAERPTGFSSAVEVVEVDEDEVEEVVAAPAPNAAAPAPNAAAPTPKAAARAPTLYEPPPPPPRVRRAASPGPHEWCVRRARAFEPYSTAATHAQLEEAWASGAPCCTIHEGDVAWRVRFEAGAPWPIRQERIDEPSAWRPVKRVASSAAADAWSAAAAASTAATVSSAATATAAAAEAVTAGAAAMASAASAAAATAGEGRSTEKGLPAASAPTAAPPVVHTSAAAAADAAAAAAAAHLSPTSAAAAQLAEIRKRRAAEHAAQAQEDEGDEDDEVGEEVGDEVNDEVEVIDAPAVAAPPPTTAPPPPPSLPPPPPAHGAWVGGAGDDDEEEEAQLQAALALSLAEAGGAAAAAASEERCGPAVPLQLASYNLWFTPVEQELRMREVARVLDGGDTGSARPCVLALQELVAPLEGLLLPRLRQAGFTSWVIEDYRRYGDSTSYGVALATRPPLGPLEGGRYEPFPPAMTLMHRGVALGRAHWPGVGRIVLGSTHLESWIGDDGNGPIVSNRRRQLVEATAILEREARRHHCAGAALLGDLNWQERDNGEVAQVLGLGWTDAFEALGRPKGQLATCYAWRFDRALFWTNPDLRGGGGPGGGGRAGRTDAPALRATAFALHGKKKLGQHPDKNKPLFASDHRALITTLEFGGGGGSTSSVAAPAAAAEPKSRKAPVELKPSKRKSPWHPPPEDVVCLSD